MEMEKEGKDNNSKYNSLNTSNEITEEELEAYRINRKRAEDPMANYVDHEYD
jgi:pre-mRNA-processing factor SLU7